MKYLETILEGLPNLGLQRPGPAVQDRAGIDLDEDLFSPATNKPQTNFVASTSRSLDAALRRDRSAAAIDLDDRPWPTLELPGKLGPHTLERKIAEQERELAMRCTQVADLYNLQERQAAELQVAYADIEQLNATFAELQVTAAHHTAAAAERKKAISVLYQENAVLRGKLETALDDSAALAQKMLTVETMFNDRELVVTTALEQGHLLKAELAAANEEKNRLVAEHEEAERLHEDDRSRKMAIIDELNRKVESLFADHGIQLKTRDKLAKRCDELAKTVATLERANKDTHSQLATQSDHTTFIETILRVERETSEARIKELTGQLEQERLQRAESDKACSMMRREMAILLRHITQQNAKTGRMDVTNPRQDAA